MLYHFLPGLSDVHIVFNVFRYLTFRAAGAVVTSLLIAFVFGPMVIRRLRLANVGQPVRDVGPEAHLAKAGTPTMGGVLIILAAVVSTLLWADLTNVYILIALVALLWMGAIGFLDDYLKVVQGKTRGLIARYKMVGQWTFGLGLGVFLILIPISPYPSTATSVPFFSDVQANFFPFAFILFSGFVVSGTSNAVNFTDGLDGLAAGLAAISAVTFGIFAYIAGRSDWANYLGFFALPGAGELLPIHAHPVRRRTTRVQNGAHPSPLRADRLA
jgi:phospho-N-acetylmuramoyl-pentapeptide-transferase